MNRQYDFYKDLIETDATTALSKLNIKSSDVKLWDLIIISAISESQKQSYQRQLKSKLENKKLPECFKYIVINDPDNCKIGSGGSTINIIKILNENYGEILPTLKILLVHAGGYSQRIPYNTVLGKIFAPVSCDSPYINDFLDLKIAVFTPFSINMQPGMLVSSSDLIFSCDIKEQIEAGGLFGSNNTFGLIAHRSTLTIGKDHGVYALGKHLETDSFDSYECRSVLQKPSIEKMREKKVVQVDEENNEFCFSDSSFYFSHEITMKLKNFGEKYLKTIISDHIEVDAYRDFLQQLGTEPMDLNEYLMATKSTDNIFKILYDMLKGSKSCVVSMTDSVFFHLGTIHELLDYYFNQDSSDAIKFRSSTCFTRQKFNKENINNLDELKGCIYYSRLNDSCRMSSKSLIEYTYIDDDVTLELDDYSYINNCMIKKSELAIEDDLVFKIPKEICMHTISIKSMHENKIEYVTIFFNKNDDLKKPYSKLEDLKLLGNTLPATLIENMEKPDANSIWNLKLFQGAESMSEAFSKALRFINDYSNNNVDKIVKDLKNPELQFYTLFDLLRQQSYEEMMRFRESNKLSLC